MGVVYKALDPSLDRYVAAQGGPIYFELVSGGHSRIMVYDRETKALGPVAASGFEPTHPSTSPDGSTLAFIGLNRIIIYRSGAMGFIPGPTPVHDVAWFPDNARTVYSAGASGNSQIFATVPAGTPEQLTRDDGDHTEPAISPDGNWLAFTLARGGTRQIWIQNFASGRHVAVTEGACNSFSPAWEPGSRALIFACDCQRGIGLPALFRARLDSVVRRKIADSVEDAGTVRLAGESACPTGSRRGAGAFACQLQPSAQRLHDLWWASRPMATPSGSPLGKMRH